MIISCLNCASRLQLDDSKIPTRPFTVRCPKCSQIIDVQPPSSHDGSALNGSDLPTSSPKHRERSAETPTCTLAAPEMDASLKATTATVPIDPVEAARMLATLLGQNLTPERVHNPASSGGEPRRALVCAAAELGQQIAQGLRETDPDMFVFLAEDTTRAIERMREDPMSIVVLDPQFDPIEHGAEYVKREISSLRPADRRRLFFVQLSTTARTADPHAAFINSVNLIFNPADIEQLPAVLKRAIRGYNDLYRDFNKALNVSPL